MIGAWDDSYVRTHEVGNLVKHVLRHAGIKLSPGTYHVIPKVEDGYHLHLPCTSGCTAPFEVDFSGVFFYFTVRLASTHACHPSSVAISVMGCCVPHIMYPSCSVTRNRSREFTVKSHARHSARCHSACG